MRARNYLSFLCCVLAVAVLSTTISAGDREPAPRFNAKTTSGEKYTNESVKGKVVLLQFWTTWCPVCRGDQSLVDTIDAEFSSKGLLVLAVDVGESKKKVAKYLEESPRSCKIVLTEDTNLAARFAANKYPIYVLIDRDGYVVGTQKGSTGERGLRRLLSKAGLESE